LPLRTRIAGVKRAFESRRSQSFLRFAPKLEVEKKRRSRCDRDDPSVVDGDVVVGGVQHTLMGFVLLASEVAYAVQILRSLELTFDRSTPCAAVVRRFWTSAL
jgi:hypothetical protein